MRAFVFGYGYLGAAFATALRGEGWSVAATARNADKRSRIEAAGLEAVDPADARALAAALADVDAVLVTAPPDARGCPGLRALAPALASSGTFPGWIGYVSSTGVYGDRDGGWVNERSELNAASVSGARRVAAERDWRQMGRGMGLTVCALRLPAIYGVGRSPFGKLRDGTARLVRKPGQVFNRIHCDDAVAGLLASLAKPRPGGSWNLADDHPAGADAYTEYAAALIGAPLPQEVAWDDPSVAHSMRSFYLDNKRVSNALAKAELDWRPRYADWREGLRAVLAEEQAPSG